MLSSIHLNNFKKHEDRHIDLEEGLVSITGENAAGKSSVLKGILFALFGAAAAGAKDHLWKWDANGAKSVGVALTLPEHGRVVITRTPTVAKVTSEDGRVLASGNTAVTKLVEESLGMVAKDLRTLCYSPQGETQGLLTMGPTAMQQKVEGLAQMETIDKVLGAVSADISKFEGRLETLPADIDPAEIRLQIEKAEAFIAYQQQELASIRVQEEDAAEHLQSLNQSLTEGQQKMAERQRLEQEIETGALRRMRIADALKGVDDRLGLHPVVDQDTVEVMKGQIQENEQLKSNLESSLVMARNRQQQIATLSDQIANLRVAVKDHQQVSLELQNIQELRAAAEAIAKEGYARITELSIAGNRQKELLHNAFCPTCKRSMDNVDPAALAAELTRLEGEIMEARNAYAPVSANLAALQAQERDAQKLLNPLAAALLEEKTQSLASLHPDKDVDIPSMQQALTETTAVLIKLREKYNTATSTLAAVKELDRQRSELLLEDEGLASRVDTLIKLVNGIPVFHLNALSEGINRTQKQLETLRGLKNPFLVNLGQAQAELAGLQRSVIEAEAVQKEQKKLREDKSLAEDLQGYLRKNRNRLASDIWEGLLNYSSALIANTTGGVLTDLGRSSNGEFTVKELGRSVPVTEASGAQRSIIGLALRVALTKVFYGDKLMLLLDEATADASDETAAAIAGMLSSLNMQIVSVSHRSGDSVNAGTIVEIR